MPSRRQGKLASLQASVTVTARCGNCSSQAVSEAFAISFGMPVQANAYAAASCSVTCVRASQDALDNGAVASASKCSISSSPLGGPH